MIDKILLQQAVKFKNNIPTNAQIKKLSKIAGEYQEDNEVFFLFTKYRKSPEIIDEKLFFEFLSDIYETDIDSFEDIEKLLQNSDSRKESIEKTGDSKSNYIRVFEKVVLFQIANNNPIVYKNCDEIKINGKILAVENGETFLNIYSIMSKFGFEQFIYLSGYPNILTKKFLENKDVVFFLDYDIEAIKIYDSINCKSKEFFKHPDIEHYFNNKKFLNTELYKKQRYKLPKSHNELQWLIKLIKDKSGVIEQEIIQ